ncbi:upstream-binding protein 1-like [Anneissia japonica]|uniref:upstream-binding protein 1-like n=1 Tax=Anneissia japonica TaxID=1529436 RepID=UPI0014258AEC|nr:upstream-binding protein 1-like [Anneissia japonica]
MVDMAWRIGEIDDGLAQVAAEFENNLSGLGMELGTGAYNMSEVLALPIFKQETIEEGFQCILNAATSPATKLNEETLTYLNQGQSYELKIKFLGDTAKYQGKSFKSNIRVLFHDKRLQYSEEEQLEAWRTNRPGERILKLDVPLSYNILEYHNIPNKLNTIEIHWDPRNTVGCYIQVHCISTEFTAKKHGGEKGVVFRIQVDTYINEKDSIDTTLHSASCQVKVFKPKGADRKHKTDREKMEKKVDKDKYQPSYDCTVLRELSLGNLFLNPIESKVCKDNNIANTSIASSSVYESDSTFLSLDCSSLSCNDKREAEDNNEPLPGVDFNPLSSHATQVQTQEWLKKNRFSSYCKLFQNYSGADLLRLSKDELIQILGTADGIRLNNALQDRHMRPRLTIYVCQESESVYHAVYLERPCLEELKLKLSDLYSIAPENISKVIRQGPTGIHVLVSDEMVQNFLEESYYALQTIKDENASTYTVIMK